MVVWLLLTNHNLSGTVVGFHIYLYIKYFSNTFTNHCYNYYDKVFRDYNLMNAILS